MMYAHFNGAFQVDKHAVGIFGGVYGLVNVDTADVGNGGVLDACRGLAV
jgi:hypothetical protein